MITVDELKAIMPSSGSKANDFIDAINDAMKRYEIDTIEREAAFLAQIAHESGELKWVKELWGPTAAQSKYEFRSDLGNTEAGDGKRFKGRGLIQITGRANYKSVSEALETDYIANPEYLERPNDASLSAAWFWKEHGLNELADVGDFATITRRINGGLNGWNSRLDYWNKAKQVLV